MEKASAINIDRLGGYLNQEISIIANSRLEGIRLIYAYLNNPEKRMECLKHKEISDDDKKVILLNELSFQIVSGVKEYADIDGGLTFLIIGNIYRKMPIDIKRYYSYCCGDDQLRSIYKLLKKAVVFLDESYKLNRNNFRGFITNYNISLSLGEFENAKTTMIKAKEIWQPGLIPDINNINGFLRNLPNEKEAIEQECEELSQNLSMEISQKLKPKFEQYYNRHLAPLNKLLT